jgi:uncharacterized membrane protein YccC
MSSAYVPRLDRAARSAPQRLRGRIIPVLQTATAAVGAWYLAELLLSNERPAFASIAAVIALGATFGQRRNRAVQLVGGVVVGISIAALIVSLIGSGPPQIGLMVILAMSASILLGGGELLVAESAVSAILLVVIAPADSDGFELSRILEAVIGGGVGLLVASLFFPPDPRLLVDRATQSIFAGLGRTLQRIAGALREGDAAAASRAFDDAGGIDGDVVQAHEALATARETARFAPPRRGARDDLAPFERSIGQIDFAVHDARTLARAASRALRSPTAIPEQLPVAVDGLAEAVWALAAAYDEPGRTEEVRRLALESADLASVLHAGGGHLTLAEVVAQVRSTAVDLVRAAELVAGEAGDDGPPTVELLVVDRPSA